MNGLFVTIAGIGFLVAFLHAAIPTHWLLFVLASRAQRWGRGRTLAVTAMAGSGHVLITTALGALVVWLGIRLEHISCVRIAISAMGDESACIL